MTTKQATKDAVATTVFEVNAHQLHRVLSDAVLFVSKDSTLPMLNAVHIESDAHRLMAVATDRFVLGVSKVSFDGTTNTGTAYDDDGCGFNLQTEDVQTLIRMSKTSARELHRTVTVTMHYDGGNIEFRFISGEQITVRALEDQFPKWQQLFPDSGEGKPMERFALRADLLARFAKVQGPGYVRLFHFGLTESGRERPHAVTVGDDFVGLIMPYGVNNMADTEWSKPEWL